MPIPVETAAGSRDQRQDVFGSGTACASGTVRWTGEVAAEKILLPLDAGVRRGRAAYAPRERDAGRAHLRHPHRHAVSPVQLPPAGVDAGRRPVRAAARLWFHDLRHSYATWLVSDGVPINVVSRLMGHEQISTTLNRYTHDARDYADLRVRACSPGCLLTIC